MPEAGETLDSRRTILVVDDEPLVVDFLATALRRAGYEVVAASGVAQARALFHRHAIDLALMLVEIALPGISGPEFVNRLPTLEPRIPVVFLTCLGEHEISPQELSAPILQKPFRAAELRATIHRLARPDSRS
jgi:DNA-binding response OmpR family regulator